MNEAAITIALTAIGMLGAVIAAGVRELRKRDAQLAALQSEIAASAEKQRLELIAARDDVRRALDEVAAHARKGRETVALSLRREFADAIAAERQNADRVYAREAHVVRVETRLDGIEARLDGITEMIREVRDTVVPQKKE